MQRILLRVQQLALLCSPFTSLFMVSWNNMRVCQMYINKNIFKYSKWFILLYTPFIVVVHLYNRNWPINTYSRIFSEAQLTKLLVVSTRSLNAEKPTTTKLSWFYLLQHVYLVQKHIFFFSFLRCNVLQVEF